MPNVIVTRHSLVRAKGEVFVLLYVCFSSVFLFGQRFLDNPRADAFQSLHVGLLWFRMCLLLFWGLAPPPPGERGNEIFVTIGVNREFCILVVFEQYLSNAWTDPHQILYV